MDVDGQKEWVELYNGHRFDFRGHPHHDIAGLTIDDLSMNLAHVNRFRGASKRPVSLAEHSVCVAGIAGSEAASSGYSADECNMVALYGLFHDVAEIVVADIPRPLKIRMSAQRGMQMWNDIETLADMTFFEHFGLKFPMDHEIKKIVKHADNVALATEAHCFMTMRHKWGEMPEPSREWIKQLTSYGSAVDPQDWALRFVTAYFTYGGTNQKRSNVFKGAGYEIYIDELNNIPASFSTQYQQNWIPQIGPATSKASKTQVISRGARGGGKKASMDWLNSAITAVDKAVSDENNEKLVKAIDAAIQKRLVSDIFKEPSGPKDQKGGLAEILKSDTAYVREFCNKLDADVIKRAVESVSDKLPGVKPTK